MLWGPTWFSRFALAFGFTVSATTVIALIISFTGFTPTMGWKDSAYGAAVISAIAAAVMASNAKSGQKFNRPTRGPWAQHK